MTDVTGVVTMSVGVEVGGDCVTVGVNLPVVGVAVSIRVGVGVETRVVGLSFMVADGVDILAPKTCSPLLISVYVCLICTVRLF